MYLVQGVFSGLWVQGGRVWGQDLGVDLMVQGVGLNGVRFKEHAEGECEGECEGEHEGVCEGECEGECAGECEGWYEGECAGE